MNNNNYLIIMAGGVGSRFWPMSTPDHPKQFLDVLNTGQTLIQQTVDRFTALCPMENVFIVTSAKYKEIINQQLPGLKDSQILLEPCMRNTAPCIAYAVWKIKKLNPDANMVVAPSDHLIMNNQEFTKVIADGFDFVEKNKALLTLGMKAHKPETGYGYIQKDFDQQVAEHEQLFKVKAFKEKPNLELAKEYLESGDFFWNSGIFLWNAKIIEEAIRANIPDVAAIFDSINEKLNTDDEQESINENFPKCENVSVDYAIMEHADNIYVKTADFGWSDLGTWGSLYELSEKSDSNNVLKGKVVTPDTKDTVVRIETTGKKAVVQGLENYIVVDTPEALLICKKDEEQKIKLFSAEVAK